MEGTLLALSLVCGFATWRLASLLHTEDAFEWLRKWIGIGNDENNYPAIYPDTFLGDLFHCFWCLSLVVALPIAAVVAVVVRLNCVLALLAWLAASTIAILAEKQIMRTQSR